MSEKHTSGEWAVFSTGPAMQSYSQPYGVSAIDAKSTNGNGRYGELICGCFGDTAGGEDAAKANAERIALSVNSHDELIAVVRDLIGWIPGPAAWHTNSPEKSIERARAAILKATGGQS